MIFHMNVLSRGGWCLLLASCVAASVEQQQDEPGAFVVNDVGETVPSETITSPESHASIASESRVSIPASGLAELDEDLSEELFEEDSEAIHESLKARLKMASHMMAMDEVLAGKGPPPRRRRTPPPDRRRAPPPVQQCRCASTKILKKTNCGARWHACSDAECCTPKGRCASNICAAKEWTNKGGMTGIYCAAAKCQVHECCVKTSKCNKAACPAGYGLDTAKAANHCKGTACTHGDKDLCCFKAGTCGVSPNVCVDGFKPKDNPKPHNHGKEGSCAAVTCNMPTECCTKLDTCKATACKSESKFMPLTKAGFTCSDVTCKESECCESKASCDSFTCGDGKYAKELDANFLCKEQTCEEDECCGEAAMCSTMGCPANYVLKSSAGATPCKGKACIEADDKDTCCDKAANCMLMACKTGTTRVKNPALKFCKKAACDPGDQDTCCQAVVTTPAPVAEKADAPRSAMLNVLFPAAAAVAAAV